MDDKCPGFLLPSSDRGSRVNDHHDTNLIVLVGNMSSMWFFLVMDCFDLQGLF